MEQDIVEFSITLKHTREKMELIADLRGYPAEVRKTEAEMPERLDAEGNVIPYALEEMVKPNPLTKVEWLKKHAEDCLKQEVKKTLFEHYKKIANDQVETQLQAIANSIETAVS